MDVAILGDKTSTLPAGWTQETAVALLGDINLDTSGPGENATLTLAGVVGDVRVRVPSGSRVHVGGFRLLGDRRVDVSPGDGPEIRINAYGILGDLVVTDREE